MIKIHTQVRSIVRILVAFLVLAALLVGIYFLVYRGNPVVAAWSTQGSHENIVYEGETYHRISVLGEGGLSLSTYALNKPVGRVENGAPVETEASTEAPDGTPTLVRDHSYTLYSVKNYDDMLILLETDGRYYLYYRELATWGTPGNHSTLIYDGYTYMSLGVLGKDGYSSGEYATDTVRGLVYNDGISADGTDISNHDFILHTVKYRSDMLIVSEPGGKKRLYYRQGGKNPPVTDVPVIFETEPETVDAT